MGFWKSGGTVTKTKETEGRKDGAKDRRTELCLDSSGLWGETEYKELQGEKPKTTNFGRNLENTVIPDVNKLTHHIKLSSLKTFGI